MTYSCSDFTDSILDVLNIEVPREDWDSPSAQADLVLAEIMRLQKIEVRYRDLLSSPPDMRAAVVLLRQARDIAKRSKAPKTLARIRLALTSAGGAVRHADRMARAARS